MRLQFHVFALFCMSMWTAAAIAQEKEIRQGVLARASAVCLVEITKKEFHSGAGCGPIGYQVDYKVLQGTGKPAGENSAIFFTTSNSGSGPCAPPLVLPQVLKHEALKVGEKHWLVFGAVHDPKRYPPNVVYWMPDGENVLRELKDAVKKNRFRWHPVYDPKTGFSYGWTYDQQKNRTTFQVTRGSTTIWKRHFDGKRAKYQQGSPVAHFLATDGLPKPFSLLTTVVTNQLKKNNTWGLASGEYKLVRRFDFATGKMREIAAYKQGHAVVSRTLAPKTERILTETRTTTASGGKSVGAKTKYWTKRQ